MAEFNKAQAIVGINEGGYQSDPRDTGNYFQGHLIGTNWGISAPVLAEFLGRIPSRQDMMQLTRRTAEQILKANFWTRHYLGELKNQSLATLIYDGVVNHGANGMRILVNKALKSLHKPIEYYSIFKPKGIKHLNSINSKSLFYAIKEARADKYRASSKTYYINGWLNRLDKINYYQNNSLFSIWPVIALFAIGCTLIFIAL